MPTCTFCSSPAGRQALFIGGVIFLAIAWHAHIFSMME